MSNQPNFEKIETVTSGYFTYIIGHFHQPDIYVLGAMDMDDPNSWSGGESAMVFYFMITPEEYGWLKTDHAKLDALATKIQTRMPKNRFYSATSRKQISLGELKAKCDSALKEDSLEDDDAFIQWKKTVKLPRTFQVPATPFNLARHALAVCQKDFDPKKATPEQAAEEEDLEKKLGWLIFKAEELYVAFDASFNPRFPLLETVRGDVRLYSTKELAEASVKYYADTNQYFATVKKLEQSEIKPFLRFCESLGVLRFRLDDGLESVTVWRHNIIPDSNPGFIERHNSSVRNSMLRTLQTLRLLALHKDDMTEEWKTGLNNWFMTWNRNALQDLGNTTLFVPCAGPEKLRQQFKADHAYSAQGIQRIQELMRKANCVDTPIAKPNFTGKHRILGTQDGKYPIRMIKNNKTNQSWLLAFTSRDEAVQFITKNNYPDIIIGLSLDELAAQVGENNGVLVDPTGIGMTLVPKVLEEALKVRSEKRVIYQSKPAESEAPQVPIPDVPREEPEETPSWPPVDGAVEPESIPQEVEEPSDSSNQEEASSANSQEKGGFFSRLFGRKDD